MTTVWLFKPRSHGREKEGTRARNGAPLPGRGGYQVFTCPIDRRLRLCARVGTQHLFVVVRRRSLSGAGLVARCVRGTSSRSASAACGVRGVRAAQQRGSRQCDSAEQVAETPSSR
jgi:hypothetical protein